MIHATRGDILKADVEVLVNTTRCVAVMGRGIALQLKKAFPAYFKAYAKACAAPDQSAYKRAVIRSSRTCCRHGSAPT